MTTITIKTQGVGLIYQKEGKWKEIFPFDEECHQVEFSYKPTGSETGSKPERWAGANHRIIITTFNAASKTGKGKDFNKFFDISDDLAHAKGVKTLRNWNEKGVLMEINDAVLSADELTKSRYNLNLKGQENEENPIKKLDKIAHSGKAEIELNQGGFVKVALVKDGQEIESKTFNYDDGSYTVTFDNDCRQASPSSTSDFEMIYNVIADNDPLHPDRKFQIDRDPRDKPRPSLNDPETSSAEFSLAAPPSTNPDPGIAGLPCHKGIIEKVDSSDLP